MTASPGQVARRKFNHDDARARVKAGESITALAREYSVSYMAVKRVVDPRTNRRMAQATARHIDSLRTPCRGGCGRLVWMHQRGRSGYCPTCRGEKIRVSEHGTAWNYRQGCRCEPCRLTANAERRRRREESRVPCSHGCGRMVHSGFRSRGDPAKPYECQPCASKRIHGQAK